MTLRFSSGRGDQVTSASDLPHSIRQKSLEMSSQPRSRIHQNEEERGVRGGEYSVRPGMQESMVFLKKLFSHQQDGMKSFPSLMSPPDGPLRTYIKENDFVLIKTLQESVS